MTFRILLALFSRCLEPGLFLLADLAEYVCFCQGHGFRDPSEIDLFESAGFELKMRGQSGIADILDSDRIFPGGTAGQNKISVAVRYGLDGGVGQIEKAPASGSLLLPVSFL